MIYFRNVNLSFLDKKLFDDINWTIHPRSRIGLVGENGTGKTTLFRAILDQVHIDSGIIEIPNRKHKTIGYLPQDLVELEPVNLIEFLKQKSGIAALEESIRDLEYKISQSRQNTSEYSKLSQQYSDALAHFSYMDGYAFEARAKQVLKGFGFKEGDFARNCSLFSGGWKMRILLTSILLAKPDIMLLDEPTNHLDTESMEWLESYLKEYPGTIIVISHDRFFLDKIALQIAELSACHIHIYKGNYSHYLSQKEIRHAALKKEMELQKAQIKKIEEFVERFRYKATKAAQVQSRVKMLEKFSAVMLEAKTKSVSMKFPEGKKSAKEVVKASDLGHSYGTLNVFSNLNFTLFRGDKVAFVGVNGSGKSTLSRLLSLSEKPSCGSVKYGDGVNMAFFSQESSQNLNYENTIKEEINSLPTQASDQEKRNLLGAFLFSGDDIYKSISVLSGGEKSRLALLKIMLLDTNFLILDEPTNHLDLKTKDIFQNALINYHGTVAIVSHDRYFLDNLVNKVFELKDGAINDYHGNYSYFIEKRSQTVTPAGNENISQTAPKDQSFKTKEKKRLEAEERNKTYKVRAALEKDLSTVERKISSLEAKKAGHETDLCDPQTHRDSVKIKTINLELKDINAELERSYKIWTELNSKLEQITKTNTGDHIN
ncbi:MAG: ABC transporter ATP-binding protein [Deltaproteobacteria bacterium HGW-Deltaproteobacteria-13]|jgi:ATP-binding cassette subfamily F protein 3|nr:MAG: ABC transporter ATP-binding protein [Deltaproteobacteria bacterium HGW-Deltaproteobacteria-13]